MRIGIDARFIGPQGTGLGKYTEKLILNLAKIDSRNDYVIFLRENNFDYLKIGDRFKKVLADVSWYSLKEQLALPKIFTSQNLDILHIPHFNAPFFYGGKFIVTIHDLIHHQFSETSATTKNPLIFKLKRVVYKKVIANAVNKSVKILTPSNFVKSEIIKNFTVDPAKIVVTFEAPEEEYFSKANKPGLKLQTGFEGKENYLIYVGNAYPHKNLNKLLDAMQILSRQHHRREDKAHLVGVGNLKLLIVSPRDVFSNRLKEEIEKRGLQESVELKGYLTAEKLSSLFQKSSAYVFPSLSEGFGIPGLNAMASGLPVVCSDITVLKEIYGDAALYFDPNNPKDIAIKINKILNQPKTKSDLVKKGVIQVKKYSWQKMAEETLKVYQSVGN